MFCLFYDIIHYPKKDSYLLKKIHSIVKLIPMFFLSACSRPKIVTILRGVNIYIIIFKYFKIECIFYTLLIFYLIISTTHLIIIYLFIR